ncbi:hypothetical protein ACOSQ4_033419 [Xanthoceras sorbifolium]
MTGHSQEARNCLLRFSATSISISVTCPHTRCLTAGHSSEDSEFASQLGRNNMRLNPEKCAFVVTSGKFLGFMVNQMGIEGNPNKIIAIRELRSP